MFALDTTSHWVMTGTVNHALPSNGKCGFISEVRCRVRQAAPWENRKVAQGGEHGGLPFQRL